MKLSISDFAKIDKADITIDGITGIFRIYELLFFCQ